MRTIEELTKEFQELLTIDAEKFAIEIGRCQNEIIFAFIAKYGIQPNEAVTCYQDGKFWVEKKGHEKINAKYENGLLDGLTYATQFYLSQISHLPNFNDIVKESVKFLFNRYKEENIVK